MLKLIIKTEKLRYKVKTNADPVAIIMLILEIACLLSKLLSWINTKVPAEDPTLKEVLQEASDILSEACNLISVKKQLEA